MPTPETVGSIIPAYNGVLAQSLFWNQERLNAVARGSDLRTTITIREGGVREQISYENLGETLAWKRLANPSDLFRIDIGKRRQIEVGPIFPAGKADIFVNHQLVMEEVMERRPGRLDERLLAQSFDRLTRQGINNILAREKLVMATRSGISTSIDLTFLGIGAGLAYLFFQGALTGLLVRPPTEPLSWHPDVIHSYQVYYGARLMESLMGMVWVLFDVNIALDMMRCGREARNSNDPYQRGFNDIYNPLKPIKDYLQGYVLLKTTPPLVEYKP